MRRALVLLLFAPTLGVSVQAAGAQPPPGTDETCTAGYESLTLTELLAQAERNGVPEQNARNAFERVNKNEDDWICSKDQPSPQVNHYNFKDNQAVGQLNP